MKAARIPVLAVALAAGGAAAFLVASADGKKPEFARAPRTQIPITDAPIATGDAVGTAMSRPDSQRQARPAATTGDSKTDTSAEDGDRDAGINLVRFGVSSKT
jgi:pilus assembly protein CpaB